MSILSHPSILAQWHCLVAQAHADAQVQLSTHCESYLVYLLMRFTEQPQSLHSIFALDFLNAAHTVGKVRELQLRDVGDKCLLLSGLFPDRANRRCLNVAYFVDLGQTAYESLYNPISTETDEGYLQLATAFVPMMDVLQQVRVTAAQPHCHSICDDDVVASRIFSKMLNQDNKK